jgi:galactarate dehydratase
MDPLHIRVHPADNVAIIVNPDGLPAGTTLSTEVTLCEAVPAAHKVALCDIPKGQPVRRYGAVIGYAARDLARGSWVHEQVLEIPAPPSLHEAPLATATPATLPPIDGITFEGYRNADGSVGTRNILGITTTVQCVAPTVEHAVTRIRQEVLPRYPGVDAVIALTHTYGCGVLIESDAAAIPVRTVRNLALNPNLGGQTLAVSLGCEKLQRDRLFPPASECACGAGDFVRLQDEQHSGFAAMVAAIMRAAERKLEMLTRRRREACPASELSVGLQCGGSDAFSGVTANPAVGYAADLLVRAGATVMFSEVTEVRDCAHLLTARAVNEQVARDFVREMRWYDDYLQAGGMDRVANTSPGNKRGGLSNIVEKALGATAKSGTSPLAAVKSHGERVRAKGLVFAATPATDFVCGTLQLAAGMNVHVFTTGEGTPYGLAMAPVIKVASRSALAKRWPDLIDVDAGRIATGEATIESTGRGIFEMILDIASGRRRSCAERLGLDNGITLFNPGPIA